MTLSKLFPKVHFCNHVTYFPKASHFNERLSYIPKYLPVLSTICNNHLYMNVFYPPALMVSYHSYALLPTPSLFPGAPLFRLHAVFSLFCWHSWSRYPLM